MTRLRRHPRLAALCSLAAPLLLLVPLALAVLVEDKTHAALAAVGAIVTVRFLVVELAPWLAGEEE